MMTHLQFPLATLLAFQAAIVGCREPKQARQRSSSPGPTVLAVPRDAMVPQRPPKNIHTTNAVSPPTSPGLGLLTPLTQLGKQLRVSLIRLLRGKKPATAIRPFLFSSSVDRDALLDLRSRAGKAGVRSLGDLIFRLQLFFRRGKKPEMRLDLDLLVTSSKVFVIGFTPDRKAAKDSRGNRLSAWRGPYSDLAKAASGLGVLVRSADCVRLPIAPLAILNRWLPSFRQAAARVHLATLRRALPGHCSVLARLEPTEIQLNVVSIRLLALGSAAKPLGILRAKVVQPTNSDPPGLEPEVLRTLPSKPLPPVIAAFMDKECGKYGLWWDLEAFKHGGSYVCTSDGVALQPEVYQVWRGSFLSSGEKEVLLAVSDVGGRPPTDGFSYGAILRQTQTGKYLQVAKLSFLSDRFQVMGTFRNKGGRDLLVICASSTHHGHTKGHCFDLDARTRRTVFAEPNPKPVLGFVFPWYDDRNGIPSGGTGLSYCMPKKSWKRDLNGDGKKDLIIQLEHGFIKHNFSTGSRRTVRRGYKNVKLLFDGSRLRLKGRPPC